MMKLTLSSRLKSGIRDKSDFGDTQYEIESRNRTTAVHRVLSRVIKCVALAVRLAFACGLVVPSQGQDISLTREFDSGVEQTSHISLDATGVYLVGQTGLARTVAITGLFIRKTDFAGAELWTRQLGPSSGSGSASGVAASPNGVYAIGRINQPPSPNSQLFTAFLEKYDAGGNLLWRRQFDTSTRDVILGVAVNGDSIYIVGEANPRPDTGSTSGGLFVRRYDAAGNTLWTRQDQVGYSGESAIAADDTGVYVVGYLSRTSPSAPHGDALFRYADNGDLVWRKVLGTGEQAELWPSLAVDNTGLYMARAGSLIKFDTAGNEQWSQICGASFGRVELAADEAGGYLVGTVDVGFPLSEFHGSDLPGQCASGYADAYVRKYDSGGSLLWTRQFGTSENDIVAGVALDGAALWVAGLRDRGIGTISFLTKLEKTTLPPDPSIPHITTECVVNAASYIGGGVAPGEIVTIFGTAIGPAKLSKMPTTEDGKIQTTLAETRILFNGVPAPLLFVSAAQSSAIVPYAIAGSSAVDVQVEYKGFGRGRCQCQWCLRVWVFLHPTAPAVARPSC
jgi:hypothetical protein